MKRIIDFHKTLLIDMIQTKKFKHRLIRYWGTTYTSEGTHVFIKKFQIYPHTRTAEKLKLYDTLGIRDQILDADFSASNIKTAWLYFKPSRWDPRYRITDAEELSAKINSYFTPDMTINVKLKFRDSSDIKKFNGWTKEQILQYVDDNYKELLNTCDVASEDISLIDNAIGMYALLDNANIFSVSVKRATVAPYVDKNAKLDGDSEFVADINDYSYTTKNNTVVNSIIYLELSIKKIGTVFKDSQFITDMMAENNQLRVRNRDLMMSSEAGATRQEAIRRELDEDNNDAPNEFFEGKKLRVATTQSDYLDRDLFVSFVMGSIEVDYEEWPKKKLTFWHYYAMWVLFNIAVIAAFFTGGGSLAMFFAALAAYLGILSVMLNIYIGSHYGSAEDAGKAEMMGRYVTVINKISMIAGIVGFIAGVVNLIQNIAANSATSGAATASSGSATAGSTAASSTTASVGSSSAAASTGASATSVGSSAVSETASIATAETLESFLLSSTKEIVVDQGISASLNTSSGLVVRYSGQKIIEIGFKRILSGAAEMITKLMISREKNNQTKQINELQSENNKYQKENDALVAEQLQDLADKELHIGVEDIKTYTNQSRIGSMMFNTDQFYEESIMNIGRPSFVPIGMREIAPIKYEI